MSATPGVIVLAATPIGDPGDAPPNLLAALGSADIVAAEDTRRLAMACTRMGVAAPRRMVSLHEHNEADRAPRLVAEALAGATVLVVSDAGTPAVSDPGYRLVRQAIEQGVRVTAIPGPSAVLTALAVSGLPTDRFTFEGFAPRKAGARAEMLASLRDERRTMVFFESARRLDATLAAMAQAWGNERPAAVCRELTKTHEEVRRGTLEELAAWAAATQVLGEVTLVVRGAPVVRGGVGDLVAQVLARVEAGERLKDACRELARAHGLSSQELYQAAVRARDKPQAAKSELS